MGTFFLDPEGGNDANDGTTFANRKKTLTAFTTGILSNDDTIRVIASRDHYSLGNATFTDGSGVIALAAAKTLDVSKGLASDWVPNTNVTESTYNLACGTSLISCASYAIASGFSTGKIAHHQLGATLDLSGYECISFLIASSSALTSNVSINLCSDTAGDVVVLSIPLDRTLVTGTTMFHQMLYEHGGALPSGINSISIRTATDPGTVSSLRVANIIACKARGHADHLSHMCVIGKGGSEPYYPILTIDGTNIITSHPTAFAAVSSTPYRGVTETVDCRCIDPIQPTAFPSPNAVLQEGGSSSAYVIISGGWNRTDMSTQDGVSWITGGARQNTILNLNTRTWVKVEKIGIIGGTAAGVAIGDHTLISRVEVQLEGIIASSSPITGESVAGALSIDIGYVNNVTATVVPTSLLSYSTRKLELNIGLIQNVGSSGVGLDFGLGPKPDHRISIGQISDGFTGIQCLAGARGVVGGLTLESLSSATFNVQNGGELCIDSPIIPAIGTWPPVNDLGVVGNSGDFTSKIRLTNVNNDPEQNLTQASTYRFYSKPSTGYPSGATTAWIFEPRDENDALVATAEIIPGKEVIGRIYCEADVTTTVTAWVKRSSTACGGGICVHEGQLPGIEYAEDTASAAVDTWEQLTLSLTPTEAGVVEICAFYHNAAGTSALLYIDQLEQS